MFSRSTTNRDDATRPPFLDQEEWRSIVVALLLSPRQAEVVGLVMQSKTDKEIAATLGISKRTVRTHLDESKSRLDAMDRVGLACRVFETFRQVSELRHRHK
ncbi:MAG: helix-turn-helix transcriptional regulator [Pirellulales bacterium]|nr:helix-turn-helix transcriptional regulator [Pirellulales bacterium]